jgi:ParB family chromosome partitioning protein
VARPLQGLKPSASADAGRRPLGAVPRPLEPRRSSSGTETAIPDESGNEVQSARTGISPRLVQDLTAQKSAAIGAELMSRPDVALAAVVHCLTLRVWYSGSDTDSCLELLRGPFSLRRSLTAPEACHGFGAVEQERERLGDRLPGNPAELWQWRGSGHG